MKTLVRVLCFSVLPMLSFDMAAYGQTASQIWATRYNSASGGEDRASALVADGGGNIVVTGVTDMVLHPFLGIPISGDTYTAKYAANSGALLWQKRQTSAAYDEAYSVAVDSAGNVLITGETGGFANADFYTAKYSAATGALLWERTYDGPDHRDDSAVRVVVDFAGDVVVTGRSQSLSGTHDIYTAKYAGASGAILWERRFNGLASNHDSPTHLAVDGVGNVVVTGITWDSNNISAFYTAKYAASNGGLLWERRYKRAVNSQDRANCVAVDGAGNVVVTGASSGIRGDDLYTAKYAAGDGAVMWEVPYNGPGDSDDSGAFVAVDSGGDVFVTGTSRNANGNGDFYTAKYAAATGVLLWERRYNGTGNGEDRASTVAVDAFGNATVTGTSRNAAGNNDYYTARYAGATGTLLWEQRYNGPANNDDSVRSLALTADGGAVVTGQSSNGSNADFATVRYLFLDTVTLAPTVSAPLYGSGGGAEILVRCSLPEAALPGSVKLAFGSTVLTLVAGHETAGAHDVRFAVRNPTANVGGSPSGVASGAPIADGVYTMTLSYQDALGNPVASSSVANVVIDATPPTLSGVFSPLQVNLGDPVFDYTWQAVSDAESIVQYPHSGTWDEVGTQTVQIVAIDETGNETFLDVIIEVVYPRTIVASEGAAVPGAGVGGSGIPAGAVWSGFGVPSINDYEQAVVLGTFKVGRETTTAILMRDLTVMGGTWRVVAKEGDAAPGVAGAVMSVIKDPLLGLDGSVVWTATLADAPGTSGGIRTTNDTGIFLDWDWVGPGVPVLVAREGAAAAGSAVFKAFHSVAMGSKGVVFTAKLSGVPTTSDSGLWVYNRATTALALALREGEPRLGSTVRTIAALAGRPGSPGQGRGVVSDGVDDFVLFRATLADSRQALGFVPQDNLGGLSRVTGGDAPGYGAGAKWLRFGLPTQSAASGAVAFLGTVKPGTGTATAFNNVAIFAEDDVDYATARIVAKGDAAVGVSGGVFAAFKDPVSASNRSVAFHGTLKRGDGITTSNEEGVWFFDDTEDLRLVAREGALAADAGEARWKSFTSLALPEGRGPIFVAKLSGATTANDVGLWAADRFGTLRLLLREGQGIGASTVKTFTVLSAVTGSPAQTRSFNGSGSVLVRVADALGAQHLLQMELP